MLALSLTGPSSIEPVELPTPVAVDDDVLVEVDLAGICGSEVHDSKVLTYRRPPIVMGHEIVGRLTDGTRVAVNPLISCGYCTFCQSQRTNICASRSVVGINRPGGFTSYVSVPRNSALPIPSTLSDGQGVMAEPLANGLHAWGLSRATASSRVGVIGAGPIGLSVALAALAHDVAAVDIVEPVETRREAAAAIGATARRQLGQDYDVVFDCVGTSGTHEASVRALANGGVAVWLGLVDSGANFDSTHLVRTEKAVRGSYGYTQSEFVDALRLAVKVPASWVEERPLADGPMVFSSLWRGEIAAPKIALRPGRREEPR